MDYKQIAIEIFKKEHSSALKDGRCKIVYKQGNVYGHFDQYRIVDYLATIHERFDMPIYVEKIECE